MSYDCGFFSLFAVSQYEEEALDVVFTVEEFKEYAQIDTDEETLIEEIKEVLLKAMRCKWVVSYDCGFFSLFAVSQYIVHFNIYGNYITVEFGEMAKAYKKRNSNWLVDMIREGKDELN